MLLDVGDSAQLPLYILDSVLQIVGLEVAHVHGRNEERGVGEEVVHLFERTLGGLWQEGPEEDGVGKVADTENDVPSLLKNY